MNKLNLSLLFFFSSFIILSQNNKDQMYSVTYISYSKHYNDWDTSRQEYSRLLVSQNESIFQAYNIMSLDSIRVKRKETSRDRNKYFTFNDYTIKADRDSIYYSETLGGNLYKYSEKKDLDWLLIDETKMINGYSCKKATVSYGNRNWTAWFTLELPLSQGPYKFHGLPGLIIEITDEDNDYRYELYGIVKTQKKSLEKLYKFDDSKIVLTNHKQFNKLKYLYNGLSLSEKAKFRNAAIDANTEYRQIGSNGEEIRFRDTNSIENLNFIEKID